MASVTSAESGRLGTLPLGYYSCSEPGDAGGQAWIDLPDKHFTIGNGSTYHTDAGSGTYLLTGKRVIFTRGPMKGVRFERSGKVTLRWIDEDGKPGRVRCVRQASSV
ncbi:hypothetical protein GRI36_09630 [Altererythrobacter gangjinensis]|uniref:Elongation factor P n=1 Tax=Pontixanthobacter gangjinensis TaxID=1028742 RepID=A0A6I4SN20_9SPHN|nr:hypothetical protein [Pontixanthobacter gangjinensis]